MSSIAPRGRPLRSHGASAVEYILVVVFLGITGIATYAKLGTQIKCRVALATSLFGGAASSACADPAGGTGGGAGGDPLAMNGPGTGGGPQPGTTCIGTVCSSPGNCFVAGTMVWTSEGAAPIESIRAGTLVLARADDGQDAGWKPVVRTLARTAPALVTLVIGDGEARETIALTPEHRLRSFERGWVAAGELVPGDDELVDSDGRVVPILAAASRSGEVAVYNLEVADFHTYFVGAHAIWAHNICAAPVEGPPGTFTVNNYPGLTLSLNSQLTDDFGENVYSVTSGPHAGQSLTFEGGNYYFVDSGNNAQAQLASAHPATQNNAGGTTYNYEDVPGAQVVPLSELANVAMRPNPKDSQALQASMTAGVPIPPIVVKILPDGSYDVQDGFTRLIAARALGLQNIPIVIVH